MVLLKRARWFEDSMRSSEQTSALLDDSRAADDTAWHDFADEYDLAEDEEIEAFYFSSAAGRARVTLGNRRFGEGGYIAGGRRQARPTQRQGKSSGKAAGKPPRASNASAGCGSRSNAVQAVESSGPSYSTSVAIRTPNAQGGRKGKLFSSSPILSGSSHIGTSHDELSGSSPSSGCLLYGSSPSGSGRRAKRNARRAAAAAAGTDDCSSSVDASAMPMPQIGFEAAAQ